MDSEQIFDVIQIGYGPVGQTSAALLGKLGRTVAVFERHAGLYALPRAGHVDHEIVRIFQSIGAADGVLDDAFRCSTYGWRNQHGETLLDIDWSQEGVSGWASDYLMYQPYVEKALDEAVRRYQTVDIQHGWEAIAVERQSDLVSVTFAKGALDEAGKYVQSGERRTVRGRYLIGADGANSFTRENCGIVLNDLGFREQWLVVDFRQKRPLSFDFDNGQICDPARPLCLFQLGKTHRRFEFMVLPGEDPEEIATPENVWQLVSNFLTPTDAELIRSTVYTFRSANAEHWREDRALLVGDAAHLMPPFLGQGMCSGVRDVANLAWKLDLVLRGAAPETLLDTYMLERKPHVGDIIEQAVALGKVSCTIDPEEARLRDEAFMSGNVPPPPPFPWIVDGIISQSAPELSGRLGPQGRVKLGDTTGLADDVLGGGWQLIGSADEISNVGAEARQVIERLGMITIRLGEAGGVVDIDSTYARFLEAAGASAILVRPDFYIFGAVLPGASLDALLAELSDQLGLLPSAEAPTPAR